MVWNVTKYLSNRMCKEEVVAEFEREVKKIKEVKLFASRQLDLFEKMETFFIVRLF